MIIRLWSQNYIPTDALAVLVCLKVGAPELFDGLKSGKLAINAHPLVQPGDEDGFPLLVETTLEGIFTKPASYQSKAQKLMPILQQQHGQAGRDLEMFGYIYSNRAELARLIEFSTRIN